MEAAKLMRTAALFWLRLRSQKVIQSTNETMPGGRDNAALSATSCGVHGWFASQNVISVAIAGLEVAKIGLVIGAESLGTTRSGVLACHPPAIQRAEMNMSG
jgi:hypothetical protein